MLKEGFREIGRGPGGGDELKGMLLLSALVHVLAMGLVVLLVAYFPSRKPPELPVYTVNLVDLGGPSGKGGARGLKRGRPEREGSPRKRKEGTKELLVPKPKEEAREVKKAEALKPPEPKPVKRPEVKPEAPKKIALAEKEKKTEKGEKREKKEEPKKVVLAEKEKKVAPVERVERTEAAARETRREERAAGREEASPAGREEKGGKEQEGSAGGGSSAVAPLVISRGNGGDGGVYKGSLFLDSDFPFRSYLNRVRDKIGSNWTPVVGYLPATGKRVVVAFRILKDGRISHPQVEKASGISFLDQSALRAVLESQPFPPLPSEFNEEFLGVHFGFEYVDQG